MPELAAQVSDLQLTHELGPTGELIEVRDEATSEHFEFGPFMVIDNAGNPVTFG